MVCFGDEPTQSENNSKCTLPKAKVSLCFTGTTTTRITEQQAGVLFVAQLRVFLRANFLRGQILAVASHDFHARAMSARVEWTVLGQRSRGESLTPRVSQRPCVSQRHVFAPGSRAAGGKPHGGEEHEGCSSEELVSVTSRTYGTSAVAPIDRYREMLRLRRRSSSAFRHVTTADRGASKLRKTPRMRPRGAGAATLGGSDRHFEDELSKISLKWCYCKNISAGVYFLYN